MFIDDTFKHRVLLKQMPTSGKARLASILSILFINILSLIFPVFIINVYDSVIVKHDEKALLGLIIGTVLAFSVDFALKILKSISDNWRTTRNSYILEKQQLENFDRFKVDQFIQKGVGDYLGKIDRLKHIRDYQEQYATSVMIDTPFLALYFIFLCFISFSLAFLILVSLVIFFILTRQHQIESTKDIALQDSLQQKKQSYLHEIINSISTIKTQAMERLIQRRYDRLNSNYFKKEIDMADKNHRFTSKVTLYNQMLIASVVTLGAILIINDSISSGYLIAAIFITARMSQPIIGLLKYLKLRSVARPIIEEYQEELEQSIILDSESVDHIESIEFIKKGDASKLLTAENVYVWDYTDTTPYELYACLTKESLNNELQARVNNTPLKSFSDFSLEKKIIYISQQTKLMPGNLLDNLCLYDNKNYLQAGQLLSHSGLNQLLNLLPDGLYTRPDMNGDVLIKNRSLRIYILILQALINYPSVIIIDSYLKNTYEIGDNFFKTVKAVCKNNKIILVTTSDKFE